MGSGKNPILAEDFCGFLSWGGVGGSEEVLVWSSFVWFNFGFSCE